MRTYRYNIDTYCNTAIQSQHQKVTQYYTKHEIKTYLQMSKDDIDGQCHHLFNFSWPARHDGYKFIISCNREYRVCLEWIC